MGEHIVPALLGLEVSPWHLLITKLGVLLLSPPLLLLFPLVCYLSSHPLLFVPLIDTLLLPLLYHGLLGFDWAEHEHLVINPFVLDPVLFVHYPLLLGLHLVPHHLSQHRAIKLHNHHVQVLIEMLRVVYLPNSVDRLHQQVGDLTLLLPGNPKGQDFDVRVDLHLLWITPLVDINLLVGILDLLVDRIIQLLTLHLLEPPGAQPNITDPLFKLLALATFLGDQPYLLCKSIESVDLSLVHEDLGDVPSGEYPVPFQDGNEEYFHILLIHLRVYLQESLSNKASELLLFRPGNNIAHHLALPVFHT